MTVSRLHRWLGISLLAKGAHAVSELLGGLLIMLVPNHALTTFVRNVSQDELLEDPHDLIATHLVGLAQSFSMATQHFAGLFLMSHGAVKLMLVVALLRGHMWAYPTAMVTLSLLVAYQLYRFSHTHSAALIALTALDLVVLILIFAEYRHVRRRAL